MNAFGTADAISGSSPLARGLLTVNWVTVMGSRIIPARAGFTGRGPLRPSEGQDHPRSRGVYPGFYENEEVLAGSSPLARGLPRVRTVGWCSEGIIPARAGFTTSSCPVSLLMWDHPRSRGVYPHSR